VGAGQEEVTVAPFNVNGASGDPEGWRPVYDFWFPPELATIDLAGYLRMLERWFAGGTTKDLPPFAPLVDAAERGDLDPWCGTARGRLSLILVLDQFPRGLWAGSARAFAYDGRALALTEAGLDNGQYDALEHSWEKVFFSLPLVHAEGPDHLARMDRMIALGERRLDEGPEHLRPIRETGLNRAHWGREIIARFGRHPHRNAALGRASTPEEAAHIAAGVFPHAPGVVPPPRKT
jgi:uncharacterized protein (DUF924 family)